MENASEDGADTAARGGNNQLIPQKHGGALMPRHPGVTRAPHMPWRHTKREVVEALRSEAGPAVARLKLLIQSPDDRVAMVAVDKLMTYIFGTPPPGGWTMTDDMGPIDLSALTADERGELTVAYGTVQRLLATATERRA